MPLRIPAEYKSKYNDWAELNAGLVNVQPKGRWSALHQFAEAGNDEAVR